MSVENQEAAAAVNSFGSKKVTQAEVAMFVQQAIRPLTQRIIVLHNAVDTLYTFLAEVGVNGAKVTQEEILAFVKSKNNYTANQPPANGTQA